MIISKLPLPDHIQCKDDVWLKAVSIEDAESFLKVIIENQEHFSRFDFIAPAFQTLHEVEAVIQNLSNYKEDRAGASYGVWNKGSLFGLFTINKIDWTNRVADVGFWLAQSNMGQGFASSTLMSLVKSCTSDLKLKSLTAHTAVTNMKAQAVLERAGFTKGALLKNHLNVRGKSVDEFLYAYNIEEST